MKKCPKCGKTYLKDMTLCPADGTVLQKTGDGLVGEILAGKYRIEERLSGGGMGTVYRATHVLMEKAVAIKVLHPSLAADDNIVARFTREARAASRISHPHAITVTDFGEAENGVVFLVMEYLRGRTLKEVIRQERPLALARVVEIVRQISGALDAAHAEGVVHRDLKSDNIMLEEVSAGSDWAKVLDFGIAKIQEPDGVDPELTAPNLIIGTPQYMSPEQCSQASEIDCRSDIYSFGVIVYEMLAGHVPFTGDSATAIMLKQLQEPPPPLLQERGDLPPAVGQVVARALSKQPEDRPQSAGELAAALALAADSEAAARIGAITTATEVAVPTDEHAFPAEGTSHSPGPTSPLDSRETEQGEPDESTIVRPSVADRPEGPGEALRAPAPPPPAAGFNPWKIMIPAAVLVLVVLGVFYATQRDSRPPANDSGAPLASDPNAQAVEPLASPTGAGESGIAPAPLTPSATPGGGATTGVGVAPTPSNANPAETPADIPVENSNDDAANDNAAGNDNAQDDPAPAPTAQRNDNQRRTPTPAPVDTGEDPPPPPSPTPRKLPTPERQAPTPRPSIQSPSGSNTPDT